MARCPRTMTAKSTRCTILRCTTCGKVGCDNEICENRAFGPQCLACRATASVRLTGRWFDGMSRRTPKAQDLMEPHPMTEPFSPKYLGLLAWVLGIYLTRLAPARLENWATVVAVIGFVAWFGWVSQ